VKSFDTATAAAESSPMVGSNTAILSIQNGLGNIETLIGIFGKDRIIGGMAILAL